MLFRTQIIFCSSELRLHFRIAEVGSLLSLNRAWRAQVTLHFVSDHARRYGVTPVLTFDHPLYVCMYVYIYSPDMDIQKYTVTMKIIVNSVKISSPIGTISNSEVVDLQ